MNNNQIFSNLLGREIVQVVFRPTLHWFSLRSSMASELEEKYEEWRADDNGNIALFSPKAKRALEIFTGQITFATEKDIDSEDGLKHIETIFPRVIENCGIKEIRRVGCRRTCIFKSKFEFSELTDLIHKRLFNVSKEVLALQGGKVGDLVYVLDTEENGGKTHVQIGAINKDQGLQYFANKFELDNKPESDKNLFFDIDVSVVDKLTGSNVIDQLKRVIAQNHGTISRYLNYLAS